jgi:hypothetical protein
LENSVCEAFMANCRQYGSNDCDNTVGWCLPMRNFRIAGDT